METKLKYPALPRELDRRRVLTEREISEMRELREQGYSSRKVGEMYGVSKTIVLYWTNDDAYRERVNKKRYQLIVAREKKDKGYKDFRKEQKRENLKSVLKRSVAIKKYKGKMTYKWKKKKRNTDEGFRKKDNEQSLRAYHNKRKKTKPGQ